MTIIRHIERADLNHIAREPYSVTIDEPGDDVDRLNQLFDLHGYWQEHHGAVAIDDNGLIGTLTFYRSGPAIHGYELGYVIHDRNNWGKGYATTGLILLTEKLFAERPVHRLQLTINTENTGSTRVAEKAGYCLEGTLRRAGFGEPPPDTYVYSKTRS